jgi:hypothetical protein
VPNRRELVLVGVLVGIVLLLAMLTRPPTAGDSGDPRASAFLSTPGGTLALYETLRLLDVPVDHRLHPYVEGDPLGDALAVLAPLEEVTPGELAELAEWIRAGGVLLFAAPPWGNEAMLDTLGLWTARVRDDSVPGRRRSLSTATGTPAAHRWTTGIDSVAGIERVFTDTSRAVAEGAVPLLTTAHGPAAITYPMGEGWVLAFADASPLRNDTLRSGGAAVLFARAAVDAVAEDGTLHFDEYHHGYRAGGDVTGAVLRFLRREPPGRAVLQLAAAGALLLLLLGRRFGRPEPPPPVLRRSPLEHVEALAGAYRQAGARRTVRTLLLAGMSRRLGRRHAPDEHALRAQLERMSTQLPVGRDAAAELLKQWNRGERADLVALARDVDRLLDEVRKT